MYLRKAELVPHLHRLTRPRNLDMLIHYDRAAKEPMNSLLSVWLPGRNEDGQPIPRN